MSQALAIQHFTIQKRKHSLHLRAVLHVLKADSQLYARVSPFISIDTETIYWNEIFRMGFGSGHRGAVTWCYGIWVDEPRPRSNCFDAALNMEPRFQVAVLEALAMRWGLSHEA
jgi:hypothetical protein